MTTYFDMVDAATAARAGIIRAPREGRATVTKAAYGAGVVNFQNDVPIASLLTQSPQRRMAQYLAAYRVGWFYKAESMISFDLATLPWSLEDSADNEIECGCDGLEMMVPPAMMDNPTERLVHLLRQPNPNQTWRQFVEKSAIRYDMAGTAILYLENGAGGKAPTALYSISPARMTPSRDRKGNLIGWVMDANGRGGGVPFEPEEIVAWAAGSPDDDVWSVSVVEAVLGPLQVTNLITQHTIDVLSMGGRLAGMLAPKNRALDEDEFQDVVRAWRNVANDPNAARRLLVMPEPMEWTAGAATPEQIGIPELSAVNRDDILTAFPISAERLGVPQASGLNSGLTHEVQERNYWQRTIHPRSVSFAEMFQLGVVDRFAKQIGSALTFELEEPDLDDAAALTEKAAAFQALVDAGFDPEESVAAVGLDSIKYVGKPMQAMGSNGMPVDTGTPGGVDMGQMALQTMNTGQMRLMAMQEKAQTLRREVLTPAEREARDSMARFFREQRDRVRRNIETTFPKTKAGRKALPNDWWDAEAEDAALEVVLRPVWSRVGRGGMQVAADRVGRILFGDRVSAVERHILEKGLTRAKLINETTYQAIRDVLAEGVRRGYSIPQLVEGVPEHDFPGVLNAGMPNGNALWDEYRAEMVARTEAVSAYNTATLGTYQNFGVAMVTASDGDKDEECADRDGRDFTVTEANDIVDHPNGTLDWIPIINEAAA